MLPALEEANHESSFLCPCRRTLSQTTNRMSNHSETAYKTCDRLSFERDFQICGCRWYFPNNTKAGAQVKKKRESSKRFIVDKYRLNRNWVHSPPLAASYILRFIKPRRAKRLVAVMPRRSLSAGDGVEGLPRGWQTKGADIHYNKAISSGNGLFVRLITGHAPDCPFATHIHPTVLSLQIPVLNSPFLHTYTRFQVYFSRFSYRSWIPSEILSLQLQALSCFTP